MNNEDFKKMLNAVDSDDTDALKELICGEDAYTASRILCYAAEVNSIETAKILLAEEAVMPQLQENYAIRIAHAKGHKEIEKLLAADKRVDSSVLEKEELKITFKAKINKAENEVDSKTEAEVKNESESKIETDSVNEIADDIMSAIEEKLEYQTEEITKEAVEENSENKPIVKNLISNYTKIENEGIINFKNKNGKFICKKWLDTGSEEVETIADFITRLSEEYDDGELIGIYNDRSEFAVIKYSDKRYCFMNYKTKAIVSPGLTSVIGVDKDLGIGLDEKERTLEIRADGTFRYRGEKDFKMGFLKYL